MKSVWYFLYFQNKFHARHTAIQTNRQTHLYTHAYTPMLDTRIEDNYNINSIESCGILMFYSKVFDVRRPKFHVFPIVLSILCALCVYGPVSKTRITGIESKPKTTKAKNTHITHAQKPAETLSLVQKKMTNIFIDNFSHTQLFKIICALSNAKARVFFSIVISFFHSHFTSSSSSLSHPLPLPLSLRSLMSVVFIVARCYILRFLCVCSAYSLWFSDEWRFGRGVENSVIFSFDVPIDRMMCLFRIARGRKSESEQKRKLYG